MIGPEPLGGIVQCIAMPQTHYGQVRRFAWGMEHRFPKASDREITGLSAVNPTAWTPPWSLSGTLILPALRALILNYDLDYADQWPVGASADYETALDYAGRTPYEWTQTDGTWVPDVPHGYGDTTWLRCVDLDAGVATVDSIDDLCAEPSVGVMFWRWAPQDITDMPAISVRFGYVNPGQPGLRVWVPMAVPGATTPKPRVLSGTRLLAEMDSQSSVTSSSDATPRLESIWLRSVEPGVYVVALSTGEEAVIVDDTLTLDAAPVTIQAQGIHCCVTMWRMQHAASGTAQLARAGEWPLWTYPDGALVLRTYETVDTSVTSDLNLLNGGSIDPLNPPTTQAELTLETTDPCYTPVVYCCQEVHPVELTEPSPDWADISDWWERWEITEAIDGRGSSAQAYPVLDPDQTIPWDDLAMNMVGQITVAHKWPTLTPAEDLATGEVLLTGFWEITERSRDGGSYGVPQLSATLRPWTWRWEGGSEPRKRLTSHAGISWAGWPLQDALEQILGSIGVPTASELTWALALGEDPSTITIPMRHPWERDYEFGDAGITEVLDRLTKACGVRWRVTRLGQIEVYREQEWDGTVPAWTLSDTPATAHDSVESIRVSRSSDRIRNVVLHLGMDAQNEPLWGLAEDYPGRMTPGAPTYLGDDWWAIERDNANTDPDTSALTELTRRAHYQRTVEWTWLGHPDLEVGSYVNVDFDGLGLDPGTIVRVISKRSTIDSTRMRYSETCTAGVLWEQELDE